MTRPDTFYAAYRWRHAFKPALITSETGRIGVMVTRSTLAGTRFQTLLAGASCHCGFVPQACDGLADAIKYSASFEDAAKVIAACAFNTAIMGQCGTQSRQIDALAFGCTHYPFARDHLQVLQGLEVTPVETGKAVAQQGSIFLLLHLIELARPAMGLTLQLARGPCAFADAGAPLSDRARPPGWK